MKACHLTTRSKTTGAVTRSLAALAVITFFVAGPADANCDKPQTQARQDHAYSTSTHNPSALETRDYPTIPISDPEYRWRKEAELTRRQQIIDGLKKAGVIGERIGATKTRPKRRPIPKPTLKPTPKPKPKPKVTKLPNGDVITEYPDGRREVKLKNGDTVTTYPNGKRVIRTFEGDTTETHPSGYRKTTNRYGDGTAHFQDGTRIDFKSSGEATLTTPDGRKFHRKPGKGFKEVD